MRALLKKEILGVAQQSWTLPIILIAVLVVVYTLFGNISGVFLYFAILSVLFVTSDAGYDDKSRFTPVLLSMPVSRRSYALSRYVFGFLVMAAGSALTFLASIVLNFINPELLGADGFTLVFAMFAFSLCMMGIILAIIVPLSLRYSHAVVRMIMFALILIPFLAAWMAGESAQFHFPAWFEQRPLLIGGGATVVLLIVSVLLSLRIAKKREYPIV